MRLTPIFVLIASPLFAQSAEEIALAQATLSQMQTLSFEEGREFCGYFGYDADGRLVSTPATRGRVAQCTYSGPDDLNIILSWHTHGDFNEDYGSEVPSVGDIEADADEGIDGFVSTPGGRLWYVDTEDMIVRQICGLGCLPADPNFVAGVEGVIENSYSYEELVEYEEY